MTAVLLVVSWFALQPGRWRAGLLFVAVAVAVYLLMSHSAGTHESLYTAGRVWANNTSKVGVQGALVYIGLLTPLAVAMARGWRAADPTLRRLAIAVGAVYLPLWAVFAVWQETRLLMPLLILALPIITRKEN